MPYNFRKDKKYSHDLDAKDPLGHTRELFYINPGEIYLDGNSLGLLSKNSEKSLLAVLEQWKKQAVKGWTETKNPWFYYAEKLAALQAPLVGADSDEIILHSSTTVNIHTLLATFFKPTAVRNKILMDDLTFPSDRYAVESLLELKSFDPAAHLKLVPSPDNLFINERDIINLMTEEVALIFLPAVLYRSGQLLNMELLTKEAHDRSILIGFDCAHSVGAVPHELSQWQVDFACWSNYKYCNGGPGSVAGLYINKKHFSAKPALAGWFGYNKEKQFDLLNHFEAQGTAAGWQIGTPHILSLAPLEGALEIFKQVGIHAVREKSLLLTNYLMFLIEEKLGDFGFTIVSPKPETQRGGHVALQHQNAGKINEAFKNRNIITDFRMPDIIRLTPVALYNSFAEVWQTVEILFDIMVSKEYNKYDNQRGIVA